MKSKGWFGAVAIAVVVVGVSCLFFAQEFTGSRREAAVARIHELADTHHIAPARTSLFPAADAETLVPNAGGNADARALFIRLAGMEKALRESNRKGFEAWRHVAMSGQAATAEELSNNESYLSQADELIRETRRLSEMAGPYFDLDYSKNLAMDRSALFTLQSLIVLLDGDARVKSRKAVILEPFEDLAALMRLTNGIPRDPYAITDGFRRGNYRLVLGVAQEVVTATSVSADQLKLLEALVPRDPERELFTRALIGQASLTVRFFDDIRENGFPETGNPRNTGEIAGRAAFWLYFSPLAASLSNQDEEYYAGTMARIIEAATLPYYEAKLQLEALDREHASAPRWRVISRPEIGMPSETLAEQANYEACLDILRMGLCLQGYHQQHGEYPESVDAIAVNMGGHVPVDSFSGQSYIYVRSGDSFLLYSVGKNGVDNGGKAGGPKDDDVVWRGKA
ncbi:MAG: hypothetical protein HZB26_22455, partial [Candidatus Hydrogenedentes bacterium]|nr:hypothetical protein [Candidatus Hydrogenedentota bacterium]